MPRLRVLLLTIPIAVLLVAGCTGTGPSSPERGLEVEIGGPITSAQVRQVVGDLLAGDKIIPGEISLQLVEGQSIDPIADEWDLSLIDYKEFIDFYHMALGPDGDLGRVVAELRQDPRVKVAEPVYRTTMSALRVDPNDPRFLAGEQWYLENMDVPEAWVIEPGDPAIEPVPQASDVVVAVLDTGFDYSHPDLNPDPEDVPSAYENFKVFPGFDYVNGDANPQDDNGHGTMIAGLVAARTGNAEGIASIAWNARIIPVKVLDQEGNGSSALTTDGIWFAVQQFLEQKAKLDPFDRENYVFSNPFNARLIINMSYTFETPNSLGPSQMELNAVNYAIAHGALLVAAAGDGARPLDDGNTTVYPASYRGTIAVGTTDQANALSPDSNTLPLSVDPATAPFFVAPGIDIISTYPLAFSQGYAVGSGSSFSAACLTGVASLIWSQYPFLSQSEVIDTLAAGADADLLGSLGADHVSGRGLINAFDSLQRSFTPNPTSDPVIIRAFTNPILHGDIVFVVRTHYDILNATDTPPLIDPDRPELGLINDGYPFRYAIGWDYDLDGTIDYEFPYVYFLDTYYWRHEIYFGEVDSATYIGRVHFPQDLTIDITPDPFPMGQLMIEFIGVPFNRKIDANLPQTVSAATTIQIDEFNYDLPG